MAPSAAGLWDAYRLRWKRRRLLWRAVRARHQLRIVRDGTSQIGADDILAATVLRNEIERLPYFLEHHRALGVRHFLMVDNASTDGSAEFLRAQPDVSLWHSDHGYKQSRFGMDWLCWLLLRHGHGHWCLTVDADELFIYPYWDSRDLRALTGWLERSGAEAFPAMMLDLYPKGPLAGHDYMPRSDPTALLQWFDRGNYTIARQERMGNLWIQGGVRARVFFAEDPRRAPTLTKLPLVRWNRRYVYLNSTHSALPPRLNRVYGGTGEEAGSGLLLHSKFLPGVVDRAREEKARREHFRQSELYDDYYDKLAANPDLWSPASSRLGGWRELEAMGLMSRGGWI
jgi:hypothetical protein